MATTSDFAFLGELLAVIDARRGDDPKSSYTAKLFGKGTDKIAQKLGAVRSGPYNSYVKYSDSFQR